MTDAEGNENRNLTLNMKKEKGRYAVTLSVDGEWLKDPARVYPVVIDPSVIINNASGFQDTYIQDLKNEQGVKNGNISEDYNHYDTENLYIGFDDDNTSTNGLRWKGTTRSFVKFPLPESITNDTNINSADLYLYNYTGWGSSQRTIEAWRATNNIGITQIRWGNQPQWDFPKASAVVGSNEG